HAGAGIGLVIESSQNPVSGAMGVPASTFAWPKAPSYTTPFGVAPAATTPATAPVSTAVRRATSIDPNLFDSTCWDTFPGLRLPAPRATPAANRPPPVSTARRLMLCIAQTSQC